MLKALVGSFFAISCVTCAVFFISSKGPINLSTHYLEQEESILQARKVVKQPARAPAAPKHNTVAGVGVLPGRLTVTRGASFPVAIPIADEKAYFAR